MGLEPMVILPWQGSAVAAAPHSQKTSAYLLQHPEGIRLERVSGIEPDSLAWKAGAQPLYHTRLHTIYITLLAYF
jgi:hypothetical protein